MALEEFSDLIDSYCYKVFRNRKWGCDNCPCRRAIEIGNVQMNIISSIGEDNNYRYESVIGVPYMDEDGDISGVFVFSRDITELQRSMNQVRQLSRKILTSQEEERQRVGLDLHDGVGQTILAAQLNFATYLKDPQQYHTRFVAGMECIEQASRELREVYSNLFPSILNDLGLEAALRWYCKNYIGVRAIRTDLHFEMAERLDRNIEITLYRIIQEVFSNIVKHSGADSLCLVLKCSDVILLEISDNGRGFSREEVRAANRGGCGLINMEERVSALNGQLEIESSTDEGTVIRIRIPQNHEED